MAILTSRILMVRPAAFGFNPQTAKNNAFQQKPDEDAATIQSSALKEFDAMVQKIRSKGVEVVVFQDTPEPHTPDSIFPNNWFSTHPDGTLVFYPMFAPNRRLERKPEIKLYLKTRTTKPVLDFSHFEAENKFLEGTGSLIIDHTNRLVYANRSARTDDVLFLSVAEKLALKPILFDAFDQNGVPIYHTNVLMALGDKYVVICMDAIPKAQHEPILASFKDTQRKVVALTFEQMNHFAGNMIQLHNVDGTPISVMSQSAYDSLSREQLEILEQYNELLPVAIPTIETIGGGSVRCMIAELYI